MSTAETITRRRVAQLSAEMHRTHRTWQPTDEEIAEMFADMEERRALATLLDPSVFAPEGRDLFVDEEMRRAA